MRTERDADVRATTATRRRTVATTLVTAALMLAVAAPAMPVALPAGDVVSPAASPRPTPRPTATPAPAPAPSPASTAEGSLVEDRLAALGYTLPPVVAPLAAYVPAVQAGTLVFTSGQLPMVNGVLAATGKVGAEVSVDDAARLAEICALNALAAVKSVVGDLDRVVRVVKVVGYVASAPGFTSQPLVVNGASNLLRAAFGDAGTHARSSVGVAELPLGAPVEIEIVVQVRK